MPKVLERSAHRFMSDDGRVKAGYTKLGGFAAVVTKPYRPIGDLHSVLALTNPNPHTHNNNRLINNNTQMGITLTTTAAAAKFMKANNDYTARVRFSNKQYNKSLKPRLEQRKDDVNSLKVGSTANGGIFRFVKPPHALELTNHTARHAFHIATQKYGGRHRENRHQKNSASTSRGETSHDTSAAPDLFDFDDEEDEDEDEVRLKTRNEIWAETHLAQVHMKVDKTKTPKRLRSKFQKVDKQFNTDVQSVRVRKATGGKLQKSGRTSAWRTKRMHKQINDEHRAKDELQKRGLAADSLNEYIPGSGGGNSNSSSNNNNNNNNSSNININNSNNNNSNSNSSSSSLVTTAPSLSPTHKVKLKPKPPPLDSKELEWDCTKCKANNYGGRNNCYKCGTVQTFSTTRSNRTRHRSPRGGLTGRRARRRSSVSRLELAQSIFAEELPTGIKEDSSDDEDSNSFFAGGSKKEDATFRPTMSSKKSKVPSYVSSNMGNKSVGGGLAGLNVAYAQSQDPLFWEHYSRDMAGALRKSGTQNDTSGSPRGDKKEKNTGIGGGRLVGKDLDYAKVLHRVNKSIANRHRFQKNIREIGGWQRDLWEDYQRELEARDIKRVDVLRQGTMVARADAFLDQVLRESHTAAKAMSMVRGAAGEIDKAQTRINRSRVEWYDQVAAEKPLSRPHHMMKELLLELCHSGHPLIKNVYFHVVLCTYGYCGNRACNADGPFQVLVRKMRIFLHITTSEYVAWLGHQKISVPRVILAELQQEELDRREQEEERIKIQKMLDNDEHHVQPLHTTVAMSNQRPSGPPDTLAVKVLQARKLLPADLDGFADPLVYYWMAPMWSPEGFIPEHTQRAYTEHAPKTLDPSWEQTAEVSLFDIKDEFWGLSVAVYDHDEMGDNDVMAYCRVGLNVVRSHNHLAERWFTLKFPPPCLGDYEGPGAHAHHRVHFGEIKLSLEWYNAAAKKWDIAHTKEMLPEPLDDEFDDDDESDVEEEVESW